MISALIQGAMGGKTPEIVKRQRHNLTSQTRQINDQKMEYAGYCLGQLRVIVLISANPGLIAQEFAVLKTEAVTLQPALALCCSKCSERSCVCIGDRCLCLTTSEIKASFCLKS